MYWELLRVNNLHIHSNRYDIMSNPISFAVHAGSLACIISYDFNIRYFLRKCLSGGGFNYSGDIYVDGKKCEINTVKEAHALGIYDANPTDLFANMDIGLNIYIPEIPRYGAAIAKKGALYNKTKKLLDEFEIIDIDPDELCGSIDDFHKQLVMILRSYMHGAKIILFNFFANYFYSEKELKKLATVFDKLREKNIAVLCFSNGWIPEALSGFDRYIMIDKTVIVKNARRDEFSPKSIDSMFPFRDSERNACYENSDGAVLSCRDFPYGMPENKKKLSFDLGGGGCLGILDSKRELLELRDVLSGKRRRDIENCIIVDGKPLFKNKKALSQIAVLDYGFEEEKSFGKLSLYDNITAGKGGAIYKFGFVFNRRIQKFVVNELLTAIDRTDLLELYGHDDKKLDNIDPEDQFVIEICRWLCIRPRAFILHNFNRNYSLLSSEKVGNLILKIKTKFQIPILIIAPGNDELDFFCNDIIRL